MYEYQATVRRVIDGDTVDLAVDLGFDVGLALRVRLDGIDTPELRGADRAAGQAARDFVVQRLPVGAPVLVRTRKDKQEKYGRYLAEVCPITADGAVDGQSINEELVAAGLATRYDGGKKE